MIKIKNIEDADATGCYDVFYRAIHEGARPAYSAPQRNAWAPFREMPVGFANALQAPCALMAITDQIVGFITVLQDGYLDLLFVTPDHHRQGMATTLYQSALLQTKGPLHTEASHLSRPFFLHHGWREITPQRVEKRGAWMTNFVMKLSR